MITLHYNEFIKHNLEEIRSVYYTAPGMLDPV